MSTFQISSWRSPQDILHLSEQILPSSSSLSPSAYRQLQLSYDLLAQENIELKSLLELSQIKSKQSSSNRQRRHDQLDNDENERQSIYLLKNLQKTILENQNEISMLTKKLEHKRTLYLELQDSYQVLLNENSQLKANLELQHLELITTTEKWERERKSLNDQLSLYKERSEQAEKKYSQVTIEYKEFQHQTKLSLQRQTSRLFFQSMTRVYHRILSRAIHQWRSYAIAVLIHQSNEQKHAIFHQEITQSHDKVVTELSINFTQQIQILNQTNSKSEKARGVLLDHIFTSTKTKQKKIFEHWKATYFSKIGKSFLNLQKEFQELEKKYLTTLSQLKHIENQKHESELINNYLHGFLLIQNLKKKLYFQRVYLGRCVRTSFFHWKGMMKISKQSNIYEELLIKYQLLLNESQEYQIFYQKEKPKLQRKLERYLEITGSLTSVMRYQATLYKCFSGWSHYSYLQKLRRLSSWPELWRLSKLCPDETQRASYKPSDVMLESAAGAQGEAQRWPQGGLQGEGSGGSQGGSQGGPHGTQSGAQGSPNSIQATTGMSSRMPLPHHSSSSQFVSHFSPMPTPILSQLLPLVNASSSSSSRTHPPATPFPVTPTATTGTQTEKRLLSPTRAPATVAAGDPSLARKRSSEMELRDPFTLSSSLRPLDQRKSFTDVIDRRDLQQQQRQQQQRQQQHSQSSQDTKRSPLTVRTDSFVSNPEVANLRLSSEKRTPPTSVSASRFDQHPPSLPFHQISYIPQEGADLGEILGVFPGFKSSPSVPAPVDSSDVGQGTRARARDGTERVRYDEWEEEEEQRQGQKQGQGHWNESEEEEEEIPNAPLDGAATVDSYSTLTSGFSFGGTSTLRGTGVGGVGQVASTGEFSSANRLFRKPSNSTLPTMSELEIGERSEEEEEEVEEEGSLILQRGAGAQGGARERGRREEGRGEGRGGRGWERGGKGLDEGTIETLTMSLPSPLYHHSHLSQSQSQNYSQSHSSVALTGEYSNATKLFQGQQQQQPQGQPQQGQGQGQQQSKGQGHGQGYLKSTQASRNSSIFSASYTGSVSRQQVQRPQTGQGQSYEEDFLEDSALLVLDHSGKGQKVQAKAKGKGKKTKEGERGGGGGGTETGDYTSAMAMFRR